MRGLSSISAHEVKLMTPRERVWAALNHKEPDHVPLDINGTCCTSLTKVAYENLRDYIGFPPDSRPHISSRVMCTVRALEDLLLHYRTDTRPVFLKPPRVSKIREMPDDSFYDAFNIRIRRSSILPRLLAPEDPAGGSSPACRTRKQSAAAAHPRTGTRGGSSHQSHGQR